MTSRSIQFKIIAAIIAVLSVSITISIIMTTQNQRRNLLTTATETLAVNTEMLNQVIRNIMLSGEAGIATRTLDSIKGLEGFEEIQIYRTSGEAAFSDYSTIDFVNDFQDQVMFDYTDRSETAMTDNEAFKTVLKTNTPFVQELKDSREMEYFFPILNYGECRGCHGEEEFIRGISHFKISIDPIYRQVSMAGIVLTVFFVTIGIVIFLMLFTLIRRLIIDKILTIEKTVAVAATGDLDVQITMESSDELGVLSDRINNMITSLKEKKQLEIEHTLTETSLKENRKYLQNIQEGLIMVDREMVINENYSRYMKGLFGRDEIAGQVLKDFLFPDEEKESEVRGELDMFISLLFNNTTADMDMIADVNPLVDCWIETGTGRKLIDGYFQRIFGDDDEVENVMIIFKDKTGLYKAEQELALEREKAQSEVDYIAALLKAGPDTFLKFIGEAQSTLNTFRDGLHNIRDKDFADKSFREIHSLKGSAAYFNFRAIEKLAHDLESDLKVYNTARIEELLEKLFSELDNIRELIDRFRDFASRDKGELEQFFSTLESMTERLGEEMGKKIIFSASSDVDELPLLDQLKNAVIHMVRNSADHGIEDPMERISMGKKEEAHIKLHVERFHDGRIDISVSDDGRGIDYKALEKKARLTGELNPDEKADRVRLLKLIFKTGFSSRSDVSAVSGRGVGLDAVRDDISRLGGRIGVASSDGKGAKFTIHLPAEKGE